MSHPCGVAFYSSSAGAATGFSALSSPFTRLELPYIEYLINVEPAMHKDVALSHFPGLMALQHLCQQLCPEGIAG